MFTTLFFPHDELKIVPSHLVYVEGDPGNVGDQEDDDDREEDEGLSGTKKRTVQKF